MRRIVLSAALLACAACNRQPSPTVFVDPALATLVPADTVMLAGVRMQKLVNTDFYKRYIANGKLGMVERFKSETGLDPAKNLWEFLAASDGKDTVVLIRGKFAEHGIEPRLERPGAERFSHKGYTMIGNENGAVVFLNPSTAAAGSAATLRKLVDNRNNVTGLPKALEQRVAKIPSTNQAWFVANMAGRIPEAMESGPFGNFAQLFRKVQFARGGFDLDQKLKMNVALECGSESDAERVQQAIRGLLGLARLNTPEDRREMLQAVDGMTVYRESDVVRISTDLPFDVIEQSPFLRPLFGGK